jgi:hypothetical protein
LLNEHQFTEKRDFGPSAVGFLGTGDNSVEFFLGRLGNPGSVLLGDWVSDLVEASSFGGHELTVVKVVVDFCGEREALDLGKDLHCC